MPSLTVENYLKATLKIALRTGVEWVSTGQLAQALKVSPGSVTSMLKTLADADLVQYKPYAGVKLTDHGEKLGYRVLRRHRLIELFLVQTLNLSWDQVHDEAEHMEHAVSDFLIDKIDEHLGHPETDPHGNPIPTVEGELRGQLPDTVPLSECEVGEQVQLVRVQNQEGEFLRYLTESGYALGSVARVTLNSRETGVVTLESNAPPLSLSRETAQALLVQVVQPGQANPGTH